MASLQRVAVAWLLLLTGCVAGNGQAGGDRVDDQQIPPPAAREDARPPDAGIPAREDARPPTVAPVVSNGSVLAGHTTTALSPIPLGTLTNRFGVVSVTVASGVTTWETPDAVLRFFDGSRRLEFNGTLLWMSGATTTNTVTNTLAQAEGTNTLEVVRQRTIAQADVDTVLAPLLTPTDQTNRSDRSDHPAPFIVILDPGHGGDDPGAVVADMPHEKALVLDVARRVRHRLRAAGIKVRMTRSGDKTLTLAERPDFARLRHGSVLVSIHANKASNASARGIETFIMPAAGFPSTADTVPVAESYPGNLHDAASLQLAYLLQRELINQTQTVDRGVKRARFEVLRLAPCPTALVEIGFVSNVDERKRLAETQYRNRIADGIALGIRIFMLQNSRPPL